jgi:hypothetical protein
MVAPRPLTRPVKGETNPEDVARRLQTRRTTRRKKTLLLRKKNQLRTKLSGFQRKTDDNAPS